MRVRGNFRSFVLCCSVLAVRSHLLAQQPRETHTQDRPYTFKSNVNAVLVPTVVRNKQGRAVGDLKKENFQVFDNGKVQTISGFSIQKREGVEGDARPAPQPVLPNATLPPPPIIPGRFIVFLFDDMHLSVEDLAQAQKAAANMLAASITDADMAAIVSMSGKVNSGLTSDHAQLQAAIMKLQVQNVYRTTGSECPPMDYYQADLIQNKHNSNALEAAIQEVMTCSPGIPLRQIAERLAEAAATQASVGWRPGCSGKFRGNQGIFAQNVDPARPAHFDSGVTRLPHSHEQSPFRRIGDHGCRSRVQCHHQHAGCPRPICQRSRGQRTRWLLAFLHTAEV